MLDPPKFMSSPCILVYIDTICIRRARKKKRSHKQDLYSIFLFRHTHVTVDTYKTRYNTTRTIRVCIWLYGRWTYTQNYDREPSYEHLWEDLHRYCILRVHIFFRGGAPEQKCSRRNNTAIRPATHAHMQLAQDTHSSLSPPMASRRNAASHGHLRHLTMCTCWSQATLHAST
jgi:hypothetical protein